MAHGYQRCQRTMLRVRARRQRSTKDLRDAASPRPGRDARVVSEEQRADILALATDFPRLWRDPATSAREKKRMMRLLIADVTLTKGETLHADIRFTGGATRSLDIALPKSCIERAHHRRRDRPRDRRTARHLHRCRDRRPAKRASRANRDHAPFTRVGVIYLRVRYSLKHRRTRLLEAGLLTPSDIARRCGVHLSTVHLWRRRGLLRAHPVNDKGEYLYEIPPDTLPTKFAHKGAYQAESLIALSRSQRGAV